MTLEEEIVAKGLTAPRITPADIEANIAHEYYFSAADGAIGQYMEEYGEECPRDYPISMHLLTICVLVTKNGFIVTGESACASPENFNAEIGEKIARENAINKLWPLLGYALKQRLHDEANQ